MRMFSALLACLLSASCASSYPAVSPTAGPGAELAAESALNPDPPTADRPSSTASAIASASSTSSPQETSQPSSIPQAGTLLFSRYPGLLVQQELPLIVYLPPGYDWTPDLLPAVYLLHGIGFDERQWIELGIHRQLEARITAGQWEPLILVMPLMPEGLLSSTDGGPDSYEAELLDGLIPFIERNFTVDPGRRALAGISRGGVWALEIALRHPGEFAGAAALSPALHMNFPRPQYDPSVIAIEARSYPAVIYLDAGDREPRTRAAVVEFGELLADLEVEHTLQLGEGGHDQEYWRRVAPAALSALVAGLAP